MQEKEYPDCDQTPWGKDEEWDREYTEKMIDRWHEGIREANFLIDTTNLSPGGRVLDLGCGVGRHIFAFARAGCDVVGVDINRYALKKAEEAFCAKNLKGEFIHADFRKLSYKSEFDMVIMMDSTFGILCEEENRWLLKSAARALKQSGILVIDIRNREQVVQKVSSHKGIGRNWEESSGRLSSRVVSFDLLRSRYNTRVEYMVLKTGKKVIEPIRSIRLYTLCETALLFDKAGLEITHVFGGFDGSDYSIGSEKIIVLAGNK